MAVIVTKGLPCISLLKEEGVNILDEVPVGVTPARIGLLNLMPMKEYAEMDYYRALSQSYIDAEIILVKLTGQKYKNAPQEYVDQYYRDIHEVMQEPLDGFIITGAPVEDIPFEEVRYWNQMLEVYEWLARNPQMGKLHICWGAQAALYAQFGIHKHLVPQKIFGVFEQIPVPLPIFNGLTPYFCMPQSRHSECIAEEIYREKALEVIAASPLCGPGVIRRKGLPEYYVTGHLEYSPLRLDFEYHRDLEKNLPIHLPYNYYEDDDPEGQILYSWRESAIRFFTNWLEYCANPNRRF